MRSRLSHSQSGPAVGCSIFDQTETGGHGREPGCAAPCAAVKIAPFLDADREFRAPFACGADTSKMAVFNGMSLCITSWDAFDNGAKWPVPDILSKGT